MIPSNILKKVPNNLFLSEAGTRMMMKKVCSLGEADVPNNYFKKSLGVMGKKNSIP